LPARPRIWAVGITRLQDLYRELIPEFDARAEVRIVTQGYEAAVEAIHAAGDGLDVIVAAGSNGAYLRRRVPKPVVLVNVTGIDLLQALASARRLETTVALITHGETVAELERFNAAFGIDFPQRVYRSADEAEQQVLELKRAGVRAIVGPGMVTDIATRAGLTSVFLYSLASVRQAFETALEIALAAQAESLKRGRLDAVLQHLRDGVVAMDADGVIESINDQMLRILRVERTDAVGRRLSEVNGAVAAGVPSEALEGLEAASGDAGEAGHIGSPAERVGRTRESVLLVDGTRYAVSATPILEQGAVNGAVVTFHEAQMLQRLDRSLRSTHRPQDRIAVFMLDDLVGRSKNVSRLREVARRYASVDATTLILGESGSGKELLAQGMHNAGPRRDGPFVAVNCGALPENLLESELFGYEEGAFTGARRGGKAGLIEAAHGGTLFLDEIGEMPATVQVRLLRVLQQRELIRLGATRPTRIDIRVIAATHRRLDDMVATGVFRQDLYYRLNILRLDVPPLRERRPDILLLLAIFFKRALERQGIRMREAASLRLSALRRLAVYPWPGNVRELENVAERLAVHATIGGVTEPIDAAALRLLVPEMAAYDAHRPHDGFAVNRGDGREGGYGGEPESVSNDEAGSPLSQRLKTRSQADERVMIERALDQAGGDRDVVCRQLGISRTTLWRKLRPSS
jgi:propionate catabolism operon transcriptional regulator